MSDAFEYTARLSKAAQAGLLGCGMFSTIGLFSPGLVLPQIEQAFATTPHVELLTQMIGAVASFSFAIGAPFAGALIARLGCRRVVAPALVLFALVGAAPTLMSELWAMVATRVLLGLALSAIFTGGLAGIGSLPETQRARMFGWFAMVGGAVAVVMFPIIGALARIDWHLAFSLHLVALAIVPLALRLPATLGVIDVAVSTSASPRLSSLFSPSMFGLLGLAAFAGMAMFLPPVYTPLYLVSVGITDPRLLAIPVTLGSIAAVFASASYGYLHARLGIHGLSAITTLVIGAALLVAGTVTSIPFFTAAMAVFSAMLALIAPNVSATALAISSPARQSQAIGLANGVMFGSQLLFPFVATAIRSASSVVGVFLAFGGVALAIGIATFATLRLSRQRRRPAATSSST